MDIRSFFVYFFVLIGAFNMLHIGMYLAGANIYDIWQIRRQKSLPKRFRTRPLVSVIMSAYNEEKGIIRCLESIRKNTYRKFEIIVVDDGSKDTTSRLVRDYIKAHPRRHVRLVTRRKNAGKAAALNYAIKNYAKGELVMTLDADSILHKNALTNTVNYFSDPKIVGVAANVRVMETPSILGLLQRFEHMIGYRSKKFYTMANCEFIVGGVASTYRRETMKSVGYYDTLTQTEDIGLSMKIVAAGNRNQRLIYAADVVAFTESVETFRGLLRQRYRWKLGSIQNLLRHRELTGRLSSDHSKMLTLYRVPVAFISEVLLLIEPFILGYAIYLSISTQTTSLFVGAYAMITLYIILNILPDEHFSTRRKVSQSLYAPALYFVFYIMNIVQVVAIIRCLMKPNKLLGRKPTESVWVPVARSGEQAVTL